MAYDKIADLILELTAKNSTYASTWLDSNSIIADFHVFGPLRTENRACALHYPSTATENNTEHA